MRWLVLVISAVFEAVWATALGYSHGFTQPVPVLVFAVGVLVSVVGLAFAMKTIPVGVAYSVWVGIGAALTVAVAMFTGAETVSPLNALFIVGIIGCVIGLKLVHTDTPQTSADEPAAAPEHESEPAVRAARSRGDLGARIVVEAADRQRQAGAADKPGLFCDRGNDPQTAESREQLPQRGEPF
ncbi:DMT family transporter [Streptomyces sp. CA-106131]|uniref:DMT family transporter n=1 Tax=Streptomyces sp. CA-106131 TaxID=3240045 RepID=UPI003D94D979